MHFIVSQHRGSSVSRVIIIIIIIIISPTYHENVPNENECGYLECLYKACHDAITVGGLFTDPGVNGSASQVR